MAQFPLMDVVPPEDPILGLTREFLQDPRERKANLGVGAYCSNEGTPYLLHSVRKAEERIVELELRREYLPIEGNQHFLDLTAALLFPKSLLEEQRIAAAQAIGGTGALRLMARYLADQSATVWISTPAWSNYTNIFAEHPTQFYRYLSSSGYSQSHTLGSLNAAKTGDLLIFQPCCHNPTGMGPSLEEWREIALFCKERNLLPFFDMAYQGFGENLESDAKALHCFIDQEVEIAVALSLSKNFGLYAERVGALYCVCKDRKTRDKVMPQLRALIRSAYSSPPFHGAKVVETILSDKALCAEWTRELASMRERVEEMRKAFLAQMRTKHPHPQLDLIAKQQGLYGFGLLDKDQVQRLKHHYGIYLPNNGRINIGALTPKNLQMVTDAIASSLKE